MIESFICHTKKKKKKATPLGSKAVFAVRQGEGEK